MNFNTKTIFVAVLVMIFIATMSLTLTFIGMGDKKEGLEVLGGGAVLFVFSLFLGIPFFVED